MKSDARMPTWPTVNISAVNGPGASSSVRPRSSRVCIPMLVIAIALVATGTVGAGWLLGALMCTAMMAMMMRGMHRVELTARGVRAADHQGSAAVLPCRVAAMLSAAVCRVRLV
jgi:hypothetical protein